MNILTAIILGAVQGLTEFLPVSSSGHLVLLEKIFKVNAPGVFFDTMLHLGTLTAVITVLWKDIWSILRKIIQPLTLYLIIGTIPAVIAALTFGNIIENAFDTGKYLGFCFLITSVILVTAEQLAKRKSDTLKNAQTINWLDALVTGIMQAIALAPGISRSGATISGALFRKIDRDFAARFSFLLSIPAILGAVVFQTKDLIKGTETQAAESIGIAAVIAGTLTAAIVGFFAVKFMLKIIKEKNLYGFAIYTGVLGLLIIVDQFVTGFVFL
ncbi:MAG: undecaprenyl-diphosphate phosphatase [Treponema sp.]|jgi:undecaprenyl-diphosphatase|nr:undecaprenyl-diphosphate phosphatase [Treponema sp.]